MAPEIFTLWLEFEQWEPTEADDPENDFFNMEIHLTTGETYTLNVWTFGFLDVARNVCETMGEHLKGKYLLAPDLFVERLDRKLMESIVADLIKDQSLKKEWLTD